MTTNEYRDNDLSIICGIEGSLPTYISNESDFVTFPTVTRADVWGKPVDMTLCMTWEPESLRWESFYSLS